MCEQVFMTVEATTERCKALDAAKRSAMFEYLHRCHMDVLSPLQVGPGFPRAHESGLQLFRSNSGAEAPELHNRSRVDLQPLAK